MRDARATFVLLALMLLGCSGSTEPKTSDGGTTYIAAISRTGTSTGAFVVSTTTGGVTTDQVQSGAEIRLVLNADGTTSGRLFVPDAPDEHGTTSDFDANLAGTWAAANDIVTLDHAADTFLRDMPLTRQADRLVGDRTFGQVRVRLTLMRQE